MDLTMSIAAMSMSMSTAKVQQQVNISMLKKSMENQETSAANLLNMIKTPAVMKPGSTFDVYA